MPIEVAINARIRRLITAALMYLNDKKGIQLAFDDITSMAGWLDPLYSNYLITLRYYVPSPLLVGNHDDNYKQFKILLGPQVFDTCVNPEDSDQLKNCFDKVGKDDYVMLRLVETIYKNIKTYLAQ